MREVKKKLSKSSHSEEGNDERISLFLLNNEIASLTLAMTCRIILDSLRIISKRHILIANPIVARSDPYFLVELLDRLLSVKTYFA